MELLKNTFLALFPLYFIAFSPGKEQGAGVWET